MPTFALYQAGRGRRFFLLPASLKWKNTDENTCNHVAFRCMLRPSCLCRGAGRCETSHDILRQYGLTAKYASAYLGKSSPRRESHRRSLVEPQETENRGSRRQYLACRDSHTGCLFTSRFARGQRAQYDRDKECAHRRGVALFGTVQHGVSRRPRYDQPMEKRHVDGEAGTAKCRLSRNALFQGRAPAVARCSPRRLCRHLGGVYARNGGTFLGRRFRLWTQNP